jgi:hypothetical protein
MQVDVVSMAHSRFLANYKHEVFMLDWIVLGDTKKLAVKYKLISPNSFTFAIKVLHKYADSPARLIGLSALLF